MDTIVTKLEVQKKNKKRVNIYLDDDYAFSLSIIAAASLHKGQKLSFDKISELKEEDELSRAYNVSIRHLGPRARSIAEMKAHLSGKDFSSQTVSTIVDRLIREKYLNDTEFARQWIESRSRFNPKGTWVLKQELLQKGISDDIIEASLLEHDDTEAAWRSVRKKLDHWKTLDRNAFKKKIYTFLSNRGFSYETTLDIVSRIENDGEDG